MDYCVLLTCFIDIKPEAQSHSDWKNKEHFFAETSCSQSHTKDNQSRAKRRKLCGCYLF